MNAETSAWGRAIVALGFLAKDEKVASKEEVKLAQERQLVEAVADLPGTTELVGKAGAGAIKKLRTDVGVSAASLKAHVVGTHGKDSLEDLTKDEGKSGSLWLGTSGRRRRRHDPRTPPQRHRPQAGYTIADFGKGRGGGYFIDGEKVTGVTTALGIIDGGKSGGMAWSAARIWLDGASRFRPRCC
jgi:hypothetical protein